MRGAEWFYIHVSHRWYLRYACSIWLEGGAYHERIQYLDSILTEAVVYINMGVYQRFEQNYLFFKPNMP